MLNEFNEYERYIKLYQFGIPIPEKVKTSFDVLISYFSEIKYRAILVDKNVNKTETFFTEKDNSPSMCCVFYVNQHREQIKELRLPYAYDKYIDVCVNIIIGGDMTSFEKITILEGKLKSTEFTKWVINASKNEILKKLTFQRASFPQKFDSLNITHWDSHAYFSYLSNQYYIQK